MKNQQLTLFCQEAIKNQAVFVLQQKDIYAHCQSHEYEVEDGPCICLCVWSQLELVKLNHIEDWKNYSITKVPLNEWMENWCFGMNETQMVVGLNLDVDLNGNEYMALDMLIEMCQQVINNQINIQLLSFQNWEEVLDQAVYLKGN